MGLHFQMLIDFDFFVFCFYNTLCVLLCSPLPLLWGRPPSVFQATAPVSIPACPELAGLGSDNGISVSWQSPPVIFKGASVSEAFSADSTTSHHIWALKS